MVGMYFSFHTIMVSQVKEEWVSENGGARYSPWIDSPIATAEGQKQSWRDLCFDLIRPFLCS